MKCDNKSVGMLVWKEGKLLLIERKRVPYGIAAPAGHVDGDASFESSAQRELKEEVGLDTKNIELLTEGRKENPCRREGGNWHYWKIFKIEAEGDIKRSEEETKKVDFYTIGEILLLAKKTQEYLLGQINQEEWERLPGLEPVWYLWLKELKII